METEDGLQPKGEGTSSEECPDASCSRLKFSSDECPDTSIIVLSSEEYTSTRHGGVIVSSDAHSGTNMEATRESKHTRRFLMRIIGKIRPVLPMVGLSLVDVGLELIFIITSLIDKNGGATSDITLEIILSLNIVFFVFYLMRGLFYKHLIDLFSASLSKMFIGSYLCAETFEEGNTNRDLLLVLIVLQITVAIMLAFIWWPDSALDLQIRETVGAETALLKSCKMMFKLLAVLKMDLEFSLSLTLLNVRTLYRLVMFEIILLPLMLVYSLLHYGYGYLMVRHEKTRYWALVYTIVWPVVPGLGIYMLIKQEIGFNRDFCVVATWCFACCLTRVMSLIYGVKVYRNFGKGLKEKVFGSGETENN